MEYQFINTGEIVTFSTLIMSGDLSISDEIVIYDTTGKLIARGKWYQDNILDWGSFSGTAEKSGDVVNFNLK